MPYQRISWLPVPEFWLYPDQKLGYKYSFQIPQTTNRVLANSVKSKLEAYSGQKILVQETLGRTVTSILSKSNPNPKPSCHRQNCKICLTNPSKGRCYQNNIGYRIVCNRQPCSNNLNTRKLDNPQFRHQIDKLTTGADKPASYEGETFRSAYTRSQAHWGKYTSKKKTQQTKSFMYHHTNTAHGGTIGPNKGEKDYIFHITDRFKDNLSRQTDEGRRQTVIEQFQTDNKITVLNSKIDFCQPLRTNLAVISKNINITPGRIDKPTNNPRQLNTDSSTSNFQTADNNQTVKKTRTDRKIIKGIRRINGDNQTIPTSQFTPRATSTPTKSHKLDTHISNLEMSPVNKKRRVRFDTSGVPDREA